MDDIKPDLKSEREHHYDFNYPFPPRHHDWYWCDASMSYEEAIEAFHAQSEEEQHIRRNPVNRDSPKRVVEPSSHDGKGYPFPPRNSMVWENGEYGINYDEAVSLFEHERSKAVNPKMVRNPLVNVSPKTPQGSRIAIQAMNEEIASAEAAMAATSSQSSTLDSETTDDVECSHKDQALDVALYMVEEIKRNAALDVTKSMQLENAYNAVDEIDKWNRDSLEGGFFKRALHSAAMPDFVSMALSKKASAIAQWTALVGQDQDWDHKPIIAQRFPTSGNSTRFHHKYKEYEYYYDIWSNIHYGYMGILCGFSESILLDGAGLEQIGTDMLSSSKEVTDRSETNGEGLRAFDDTTDNLSIRIGIELYRKYPNAEKISADILMQYIESADYPIMNGSKILHECK